MDRNINKQLSNLLMYTEFLQWCLLLNRNLTVQMYRLCLGFFPFFNHESTFIKTFKSKFCFHNVIKASCYDTFTVFVVKKNIF